MDDASARRRLLALLGLPLLVEHARRSGLRVPRGVTKDEVVDGLARRPDLTLEAVVGWLDERALETIAARLCVGPRRGPRRDLERRVLCALTGWRSFGPARAFARSLGLRSRQEWAAYVAGGGEGLPPLPLDVPSRPERAYGHAGWRDYPDWLGAARAGSSRTARRRGRASAGGHWPFRRARAFVHRLGLLDVGEWRAYVRGDMDGLVGTKPAGLPSAPNTVYAGRGWATWRDWLGTDWLAGHAPGWRPFKKARRFAWGLGLRDERAWRAYARGGLAGMEPRPADVPADPARVYGPAWRGWDDWLGVGRRGRQAGRRFRSFEAARAFARSLDLADMRAWRAYCRGDLPNLAPKPDDVPSDPASVYVALGWKGVGDWLGTGRVGTHQRSHRPFEAARDFARGLGLRTEADWKAYVRGDRPDLPPLPPDVPAAPRRRYRGQGWSGFVDWLRPPFPRAAWRSFEEARAFVRLLGLRSIVEWNEWCAGERPPACPLPPDVPTEPQHVYWSEGWAGWADWLGPHNLAAPPEARRPLRSYHDARRWAQAQGIRSQTEWGRVCTGRDRAGRSLPADLPSHPDRAYRRHGWRSWGEFLGTGVVATFLREYRAFDQARDFARGLGLETRAEWRAFCRGQRPDLGRLPPDVPAAPQVGYRGRGWVDFPDWLGLATRPRSAFRPFEQAREFARSLGLRTSRDWAAFGRGDRADLGPFPDDLPLAPQKAYEGRGWAGWPDFLGTARRPFEAAREFARGLGLRSAKEWAAFVGGRLPRLGVPPRDVPRHPAACYLDAGWQGWGDFLGTGNRRGGRRGRFRAFDDARRFARSLALVSYAQWNQYVRGQLPGRRPRPDDVPKAPHVVYREAGWAGWADWLGTASLERRRRGPASLTSGERSHAPPARP